MFSNRRPYYGLKLSIAEFFREPVRYLKTSNTQESMMEKPYLIDEYPKMHLSLQDFKHKPKKRPGFLGPIASGVPHGGFAILDFGEAGCGWDILNTGTCIDKPIVITMSADYFLHAEFELVAQIAEHTISVGFEQLPGTEAFGWDDQDYLLTFPENANGSVTICGFASTNTLISQTFETVVAGMPVGIYKYGGGLVVRERGQAKPAVLLSSSYGVKGAKCGCITVESSCAACADAGIGYTSQQMSTDEVQSLTIVDGGDGCNYSWNITSGGGSMVGSTYTAPSTNEECADNPTITLSVDGIVLDTINLAVNASSATNVGYDYSNIDIFHTAFDECTQVTGTRTGCLTTKVKRSHYRNLHCDGTTTDSGFRCGHPTEVTNWTCEHCAEGQQCPGTCPGDCVYPSDATIIQNCINTKGAEDQRTEAEKAAGCCPAQLL